MNKNIKSKYVSSAVMLIIAMVVVKIISALYKIPLTYYIGATGRGYFAIAYNLFMPIHIITMGSLPIALSGLVSRYNSNNNQVMIKALKISANKLFFIVGIIGSLVVLICCVPYCKYIAKSPNSIYTVLMLIPTVLFSTMSGSFRGFFEGFLNMTPTSVSQTIDAIVKAIFGLLFAFLSTYYLHLSFINKSLPIFENINTQKDALSIIYPITTAFAMLGVSLGSVASFIYLVIYSKRHYKNTLQISNKSVNIATKKLTSFSFSIMLSCIAQSIFQFLDTASVQLSLTSYSKDEIRRIISDSLKYVSINDEDLYTYIYGLFNSALDFKNIIPGITMAIGICAVPAISSAFNSRNIVRLNTVSNMVFKYTTMLSTFCGAFLFMESESILGIFYNSNSDIVVGCNLIVKLFAITAFVYSIAGSSVFCVQAIGLPKKSILAFVVSGVVRILLNVTLVTNININLVGTIVSGLIGYCIIAVWNIAIFIKYSKAKLSIKKCFFEPLILSVFVLFLYKTITNNIVIADNGIHFLIIKAVIFLVIYLVCSTILNILDVKEAFYLINCKKHLQNP